MRDRLEKLGFTLSPDDLNQTYQRFLAIADKKQEVFDEDLLALVRDDRPIGAGLRPTSIQTA